MIQVQSSRIGTSKENEDWFNSIIKTYRDNNILDANNISDGYHTFGELYDHRITLYIALCKILQKGYENITEGIPWCYIWRTKKHSDGSEWDGWFILGINIVNQITYHLPISRWEETNFATTLDKAPEWDGHTSEDVLQRLRNL